MVYHPFQRHPKDKQDARRMEGQHAHPKMTEEWMHKYLEMIEGLNYLATQ